MHRLTQSEPQEEILATNPMLVPPDTPKPLVPGAREACTHGKQKGEEAGGQAVFVEETARSRGSRASLEEVEEAEAASLGNSGIPGAGERVWGELGSMPVWCRTLEN